MPNIRGDKLGCKFPSKFKIPVILSGKYVPSRGKSNKSTAISSLGQPPDITINEKGGSRPFVTPMNDHGRIASGRRSQRFRVEFFD